MKITKLGNLIGPVFAYGGALGNLSALGALLREATRAGIPAARVIATGDIAGPCAQSSECVAATRAFGGPVVAGNIERQLATSAADSGSGFAAGCESARLARYWWAQTNAQIDGPARDWMEALPDMILFAHEGRRYAVIHGGFTDAARYLWPSSPEVVFRQELTAIEAAAGSVDAVIAGHCGIAFERMIGGVHWINTGMIGLPPHDGRRGGRYVRLDSDGARILRLDYDPNRAFAAMVATGHLLGFDLALMEGYWPSEDFLPEEMKTPV
ncbi:MAG: metallophosphoesterase family protein [Maritimibacter sp.]